MFSLNAFLAAFFCVFVSSIYALENEELEAIDNNFETLADIEL
jgi:hypothetical protein